MAKSKKENQRPPQEELLKALEVLEDQNSGRLTPESLVQAAEAETHPWHNMFNWDNETAAHQHRLHQARQYISGFRITYRVAERRVIAPVYVRDPDAHRREQGYVAVKRLMNDRERSEEALDNELVRVQAILERMREIAAVLELTEPLEVALETVMALHGRLRRRERLRPDFSKPSDDQPVQ